MNPVELINILVELQRWGDIIDIIISNKYGGGKVADEIVWQRLGEISAQLHFLQRFGVGIGEKDIVRDGNNYACPNPAAIENWLRDGVPGITQDQVNRFTDMNDIASRWPRNPNV